jgi:hypothetical protein
VWIGFIWTHHKRLNNPLQNEEMQLICRFAATQQCSIKSDLGQIWMPINSSDPGIADIDHQFAKIFVATFHINAKLQSCGVQGEKQVWKFYLSNRGSIVKGWSPLVLTRYKQTTRSIQSSRTSRRAASA